jgi:hypothetical protein
MAGQSTLRGDRETAGISDSMDASDGDAPGEMDLRLDLLIEALERAAARDSTSRLTDKPQGAAAGPTGAGAKR